VAATEPRDGAARPLGWLTLAALALPGVMPQAAVAEEAPEHGSVAVKYLRYQDSQSVQTRYPYYDGSEGGSFKRISVEAPALQLVLPLGRRWLVEASGTVDRVSGASPRYYSDVSGASRMEDRRTAFDAKVTRYFERAAVAVGAARSTENDYDSNAVSLEGRWSSADNNTVVSIGLGGSNDTITPVGGGVLGITEADRKTYELMLSVTRAMGRDDLAQISLGYSQGRGYFSDPYKQFDRRPDKRDITTMLLRWNHHFDEWGTTLRSSYRHYSDSFDVQAHSVELQWVVPLPLKLPLDISVSPSLRYHTQSAASFYFDPVTDLAVYPGTLGTPEFSSVDQRLSAFGGITAGLKLELQFGDWATSLKLERYEQRAQWRLGGEGSIGIDPFHANFVQVGLALRF